MKKSKTAEKNQKGLSKRYIIISSLTLLLSAFMLIMATIAWFTGTAINGSSATVVIDTEGIDLVGQLYIGNDIDRDGILDGAPSDTDLLSQYTVFKPENEHTENACLPGTKITYRLVVFNPNNFAADISTNFAPLDSYFAEVYPQLGLDDTTGKISSYKNLNNLDELNNVLGENSARIMFKVSSIKANEYTLKNGIDTSSESALQNINNYENPAEKNLNSTSNELWNISAQQKFIENCEVGASKALVIDYTIECMQLDDIITGYRAYCTQYITDNNLSDEYAKKVNALCEKELEYVTDINITDDSETGAGATTRQMNFTISYLSVKGVQK